MNKIQKLVADVLVIAEAQVLLVRYTDIRKYDGEEGWFVPDDYLAYAEHPHDAARRILQEQAGLNSGGISLSYIESLGGEEGSPWHLIFHHKVELEKRPIVTAGDNVKAAEWFSLDDLPQRSTVAHAGWALDIIEEILKSSR